MKTSLTTFLPKETKHSFSDKRIRYANLKHKVPSENLRHQRTNDNALDLDNNHNFSSTKTSLTRSCKKKSLLFLNHGLTRNDITKIKTSLGKFNIKLTKIPVRILSSYKAAATPLNVTWEKKKMYGEMFFLSSTNSSYGHQCLDFFHQQLLYFLLQKQSTSALNQTYQKLLSSTASNSTNFPNASRIYSNIFSVETANDILPWDLLAIKPVTSTSLTVGNEWTKDNSISLLLNYVNDSSITFSGCLKKSYPLEQKSNCTNISVIHDNMALYNDFAHLSYSDLQKVLLRNFIMALEPYNLSYSPLSLSLLYLV